MRRASLPARQTAWLCRNAYEEAANSDFSSQREFGCVACVAEHLFVIHTDYVSIYISAFYILQCIVCATNRVVRIAYEMY